MGNIFYIIGVVVVVLAILGYLGLRETSLLVSPSRIADQTRGA